MTGLPSVREVKNINKEGAQWQLMLVKDRMIKGMRLLASVNDLLIAVHSKPLLPATKLHTIQRSPSRII